MKWIFFYLYWATMYMVAFVSEVRKRPFIYSMIFIYAGVLLAAW